MRSLGRSWVSLPWGKQIRRNNLFFERILASIGEKGHDDLCEGESLESPSRQRGLSQNS